MPTIDNPTEDPSDPDRNPATGYWPKVGRSGGWPNMEDPWTLAAAPPRGPRQMMSWKQTKEEEDRAWLNKIQFGPSQADLAAEAMREALNYFMENPEIIAGPGIDEPEPKPKKKAPKKKPNLPEPPVV